MERQAASKSTKKEKRRLWIALWLLGIIATSVLFIVFFVDFVTISDSKGLTKSIATMSGDPSMILEKAGVQVGKNDLVEYSPGTTVFAEIYIDRSFPVSIAFDGTNKTSNFESGTVADALVKMGIEFGEDDIISPSMNTALARDMEVEIKRVTFDSESMRAEVSNDDAAAYKESLEDSAKSKFSMAKSRIYDVVFEHRYVDAVLSSSQIMSMSPVVHPFDDANGNIFTGEPLSSIDSFIGVEIGEDGIPKTYKRKMSNAICTAYSSSSGRGASGLGLYCGTVAVNPNVIPYGTRLFIRSSDGKFVYGFAIATDCGTAMLEGRVDIDLYFETNKECNSFGRRQLDVYIFD
ncbi:MAG: 3D domain-containing protein [Eubacteriaceae bacterium]|nr:3D domain-containing protein [Eubacteriaceae bacterium]